MITDEEKDKLIQIAIEARNQAYAPYSNYQVGAERVAVFKAVSEGEREFLAIVVATVNGGMPCGSCRQVLAEFGLETLVIIANLEGKIISETPIGELLPGAFRPKDLPPKKRFLRKNFIRR